MLSDLWLTLLQFFNFNVMYVPDSMKLNKFQLCAIPDNKSYFTRLGTVQAQSGQYTGEDFIDPYRSKIEQLSEIRDEMLSNEDNG